MDIERDLVKIEEVQEAIEELMHGGWQSSKDGYPIKLGEKTIDLAVAALQEYQPWVSVSDRMPTENDADSNGKIQIYWDDGIVDTWNHTALAKHITKFYSEYLPKVTYWKPLPEPPKGE